MNGYLQAVALDQGLQEMQQGRKQQHVDQHDECGIADVEGDVPPRLPPLRRAQGFDQHGNHKDDCDQPDLDLEIRKGVSEVLHRIRWQVKCSQGNRHERGVRAQRSIAAACRRTAAARRGIDCRSRQ